MSGSQVMVVMIVLIISIFGVIKARYRAQHGITRDRRGNEFLAQQSDTAAQREIEELRERVKVLERITTDANSLEGRNSKAIADEIESLRDR